MERDTRTHNELDRLLGEQIAGLDRAEPPPELMAGVMARVRPKRAARPEPWWTRAARWLWSPHTVRLRPALALPVAAALVLALTFTLAGRLSPQHAPAVAGPSAGPAVAEFVLNMPEADTVAVIGTFNQWSPTGYEMRWDKRRGLWVLAVPLERGRHKYGFLVDGEYVVPDPRALFHQEDGFGNANSVLIIPNGRHHEQAI